MTDVPADRAYVPFRSFSEWAATISSSGLYNDYVAAWRATTEQTTADERAAVLDFVMRSAALETGALEGLYETPRGITFAVAMQGAAWQAALHEIGPDVQRHFEAQLDAFETVFDVATGSVPLTEFWIRQLHSIGCRNQLTYRVFTEHGWQDRPLRHGENKSEPNHVVQPDGTPHSYCPVVDVVPEMTRLVNETKSVQFESSPPVVQTAYFHHALTTIHPFADGNGRVARAASSVFLYRDAGVPLVVFADQSPRYLMALAAADDGDSHSFVQFIEDRALDALVLVRQRLSAIRAGRPEEHLRRLFGAHGGLSHSEVEMIAGRVLDLVKSTALAELDERLPHRVEFTHADMREACSFDRPYHSPPGRTGFKLTVHCNEPVTARAETTPMLGIADDTSERYVFTVIDANRGALSPLQIRLDEVDPITEAGQMNIDSWMENTITALLSELTTGVEQGLAARGYRTG